MSLLAGCFLGVVGSGDITTVTPEVDPFSRVQVNSAFAATLRNGGAYALLIRADDNVIDRVRAEVSGDTLEIDLDGTVVRATLEAEVTVPGGALAAVEASGASTITAVDMLQAAMATFDVQADGASTVTLDIDAQRLVVSAEGASTVELTGRADDLEAVAEGASTLRLFELVATDVRVTAQGASTAEVSASASLDAEASGASTIRYDGSPDTVAEDSSGASSIEAR
jgi:hypothetical protein